MRYVAAEGGRFPFDFDQLYPGELFPDQLGPPVTLDAVLAGKKFARFLEHIGEKPRRESRVPRRVMVAVGGSFLSGSTGQQVVEPYSLSRHDVPMPVRIVRLANEIRDPIVQADLANPRQLRTVLKHGASRPDWSEADPWAPPAAAVSGPGEIIAGLLAEGFIEPEMVGVNDERLLELLGMAMRLPDHRLKVLAQAGGWQSNSPLAAEYRRAAQIAGLLNSLPHSLLGLE